MTVQHYYLQKKYDFLERKMLELEVMNLSEDAEEKFAKEMEQQK